MYNTGTISTTVGSNIVTGTGTVWSTNISAGDVLVLPVGASGKLYRVFSVDSDTQITLWGNVSYTVSDSPYELGTDFTTSTILSSEDIAVANVYSASGLAGLAKTGVWDDVQDKPTEFTPSAHTHVEADITDLDKYSQAEVDSKLALRADDSSISVVGKSGQYGDLLNVPTTFTPSAHTHIESDITDLDKYTTTQTDNLLADKWDKQAVVQSGAFTAQVNTRYWLTGTGDVTLPTSASTGDMIELTKSGGTVLVSGQIVYDGTTDTSLEWDLETKLEMVWTGSAWSVQIV